MSLHNVTVQPSNMTANTKLTTISSNIDHLTNIVNTNELQQFSQLVNLALQPDFIDSYQTPGWQPVSVTGMSGNYEKGDEIGSWRLNFIDELYAKVLFERIKPHLQTITPQKHLHDVDERNNVWVPVNVNPYMRLIRYEVGGWLVPHYDAPWVKDTQTRTMRSLVICLHAEPDNIGGATRFLCDPEKNYPVENKNLNDKNLNGETHTIFNTEHKINHQPGDGILFDHRILHDGEKLQTGRKVILRTDVTYERA